MRLLIDTNVFVSGVFWHGLPGRILDGWVEERFELLASGPVLDEYRCVIDELSHQYGFGDLAVRWLVRLAGHAVVVDTRPQFQLCRDPHDDMFLDCAV